jgi:hypothetical protein
MVAHTKASPVTILYDSIELLKKLNELLYLRTHQNANITPFSMVWSNPNLSLAKLPGEFSRQIHSSLLDQFAD